ncbi:MAG: 16S rRNA (adenine(1518)-N(6)/adenine(1519)-N(6))-dimethyltransferase RsmA [Anaerolineales bacterium]
MVNVPALLRQYGLRPDKRLGQNFLVDEHHLARIVEAAGVTAGDEVLEIGAGLGSLTLHLAAVAARVVAVELDRGLLPVLGQATAGLQNVELVQGDILRLDLSDHFKTAGFLVVANIPYYLTSNLIRHLLEGQPRPGRLALTIQREVAERACAQPPDMSLLSLGVQLYGQPRIAHHIPAGAFYPAPKVDSALLLIDLYPQPRLPEEKVEAFFALAKAAFAQKRKTLANSLASLPGLTKPEAEVRLQEAGIDPRRRPQTLTLEEWGRLL